MKKTKYMLYALITVLMWATLGISLKLSVTYLDDFAVALFVGIFTVLAFAVYLFLKGKFSKAFSELKKYWIFFSVAGIIGLGIQQLVYIKAYSLLPASQVIILFYTYPLLIVLLSMFFGKEKTRIASILLLVLGFIGIYLIVSKGTLTLISFSLGTIMALGAALAWAVFSYMLKKVKSTEDTIAMFWYSVFGLIFLTACLPFYDISYAISGKALLGLLYIAIFPTAIAFLLWGKALSRLPAHICSSIALLTPVFSLIIIAIFLKEKIIAMQVIGLGLVIASTAVNIYLSKGKR